MLREWQGAAPALPKRLLRWLIRRLGHLSVMLRPHALYRLVRGNLDHLPDAVLVVDARGLVRLANIAAAQRFGVAQPGYLVGRAADLLLAQHIPSVRRDLPSLRNPDTPRAFALETPDGSPDADLLIKGVPRTTAAGRLSGWIVTLVDITSVREAQRRRDEALRFISHDIRAPQTAILGLIEMRRHRQLPGDADEILARIDRLAHQSIALADSFLDLARAETGIYIFELANLDDLVLEAADRMWAQARAAQIQIITEVSEEGAYCPVERSLLQRALVNLIDNAIKFSPPGRRVRCTVQREGAWWILGVHDQGRGMPPHELPLLFQRFRRLPQAGCAQPAGTGLGLAFVKAVVTQHRGHAEVFSAEGLGTEFRIRIPARDG